MLLILNTEFTSQASEHRVSARIGSAYYIATVVFQRLHQSEQAVYLVFTCLVMFVRRQMMDLG